MKKQKSGGFILDRFILGQLASPFLFGIMSFTVIIVSGSLLFTLADLLINRGVSMAQVFRLFLYSLPAVVVLTIPMSCLLGTLLGFGNMSANSELVALKSAGISFGRIVRPVVLVCVFISIFSFAVNETVVPLSQKAAAGLMRQIYQRVPPISRNNVFIRDISGGILNRIIYVREVMPRSGEMKDIMLQEFENGDVRRVISAPTGFWSDGIWWLSDGQVFGVRDDGLVELLFRFERQRLNLDMNPSALASETTNPDEMNLEELYSAMKNAELHGNDSSRYEMFFYLRIAVPWASVVLALVGASVGSRPQRSSSGMGLGLSVVIVFCYYVIMSLCRSLGESNFIPGLLAAWIPNVVFLSVGLFLIRRANKLG